MRKIMKKYFILLLSVLVLSSCKVIKKPTPENVYNFYTACAKGDTESVKQFLTDFPDSADIEIFSDKKNQSNNYTYQRFAYFLINEKLVSFSENEKDDEQKFIREYKRYPIHIAARYGYLDIVKILIEHNSNVNLKADQGLSPLFFAINGEHYDIVKALLDNKANVNQKNDEDLTPLAYAIYWNKDLSIIKELLNSNADIEMTSQTYTPLMIAASNDNKDIMELLIAEGANINAKTEKGQSALELCAVDGNKTAIEVLLKHGVNINEQGTNGNTALMSAAGTDNFELVKYLINAGADTKIKNTLGYNALDFAVAAYEQNKKSFQLIDYLESKGLKCTVVDLKLYKQQYVKAPPKPVTPESQFKYKLDDYGKGVMITQYLGNSKVLEIPSQLEGFPVTQIGQWENSIFDKSYKKFIFDEVIIPDTVTTIKEGAFSGANIRKIKIPENIKSFNGDAVCGIGYLEELILPSVIESNDFGISFTETCNLKEITIPKSTRPSYYVSLSFEKNSRVNKIIIPEGITNVSLYGKIKNVDEIVFPNSIECITGRMLFYPHTKYTFQNPNKQLRFSYYDMFHSEYVQNFMPYIADNLSLKEQKEIQDIWRNLGYTSSFAEENIF